MNSQLHMWHGGTIRQQGLHGRQRQIITLLLAALLIIALIISIREVAANNSQQANGSAAPATFTSQSAVPKGDVMDETQSNSSESANTASQSVTTQVHSTTDANGQTNTSITVNGKPVQVPASGELHRTMSDGNSTTQLDISNGASGTSSSTSVNVQVNGSSTSTSE